MPNRRQAQARLAEDFVPNPAPAADDAGPDGGVPAFDANVFDDDPPPDAPQDALPQDGPPDIAIDPEFVRRVQQIFREMLPQAAPAVPAPAPVHQPRFSLVEHDRFRKYIATINSVWGNAATIARNPAKMPDWTALDISGPQQFQGSLLAWMFQAFTSNMLQFSRHYLQTARAYLINMQFYYSLPQSRHALLLQQFADRHLKDTHIPAARAALQLLTPLEICTDFMITSSFAHMLTVLYSILFTSGTADVDSSKLWDAISVDITKPTLTEFAAEIALFTETFPDYWPRDCRGFTQAVLVKFPFP